MKKLPNVIQTAFIIVLFISIVGLVGKAVKESAKNYHPPINNTIKDERNRHFTIIKDTINDTLYYSVIYPCDTFAEDYLTEKELIEVLKKEN